MCSLWLQGRSEAEKQVLMLMPCEKLSHWLLSSKPLGSNHTEAERQTREPDRRWGGRCTWTGWVRRPDGSPVSAVAEGTARGQSYLV